MIGADIFFRARFRSTVDKKKAVVEAGALARCVDAEQNWFSEGGHVFRREGMLLRDTLNIKEVQNATKEHSRGRA